MDIWQKTYVFFKKLPGDNGRYVTVGYSNFKNCKIEKHVVWDAIAISLLLVFYFVFFSLPDETHCQQAVVMVINANAHG